MRPLCVPSPSAGVEVGLCPIDIYITTGVYEMLHAYAHFASLQCVRGSLACGTKQQEISLVLFSAQEDNYYEW